MEFMLLDTERLTLRLITAEGYAQVMSSYTDEALLEFFGYTNTTDLEREKERYQKGTVTFNRSFLYSCLLLKNTNKVIGWCGFHTWYLQHDRAELGYGIYNEAYKQQGYMKEALRSVIQYGFGTMKLNRIEALVATYNQPSIKLLEGNCFNYEGLLKEHYLVNGVYEDSALYALLKKDYKTV